MLGLVAILLQCFENEKNLANHNFDALFKIKGLWFSQLYFESLLFNCLVRKWIDRTPAPTTLFSAYTNVFYSHTFCAF